MPLTTPTISRQWKLKRTTVTRTAETTADMHRKVMLEVKTQLKGYTSGAWQVRGSSNAVAAGLDGVDRWTAYTSIVLGTGGAARSWIVLRQPGTGMELCISFDGATYHLVTMMASLAGFTGGSLTARPTATDERALLTTAEEWYAAGGAAVTAYVHSWQTEDGENTMVTVLTSSGPRLMQLLWVLGKAGNAIDQWTTPYVGWAKGSGGSSSNLAPTGTFLTASRGRSWVGTEPMDVRGLVRITRHATSGLNGPDWIYLVQDVVHGLTGDAPFWPIGIWGATVGKRGTHGVVRDLWIGLATHPSGTRFPATGEKKFVKVGYYVFPWDDSSLE